MLPDPQPALGVDSFVDALPAKMRAPGSSSTLGDPTRTESLECARVIAARVG